MNIQINKEIVKEYKEIQNGIYFFTCQEGTLHKFMLSEEDEDGIYEYFYETLSGYNNEYWIKVRKDFITDAEELPYKVSAFFRDVSGEVITRDEYNEEREEVLKRLI